MTTRLEPDVRLNSQLDALRLWDVYRNPVQARVVGWVEQLVHAVYRACCQAGVVEPGGEAINSISICAYLASAAGAGSSLTASSSISITLGSIMCRTLNWARLWRGSTCHADQFCVVGAVCLRQR